MSVGLEFYFLVRFLPFKHKASGFPLDIKFSWGKEKGEKGTHEDAGKDNYS